MQGVINDQSLISSSIKSNTRNQLKPTNEHEGQVDTADTSNYIVQILPSNCDFFKENSLLYTYLVGKNSIHLKSILLDQLPNCILFLYITYNILLIS